MDQFGGEWSRIFFCWRIPEQDRCGIVDSGFDPSKPVDASTCPLRVLVDFDPTVTHDFTKELSAVVHCQNFLALISVSLRFKTVAVNVTIFNGTDSEIIFDFECLDYDQVFDSE